MTKEIHDINTKVLDFVVELIEYIAEYPDDDYMTMECLCRKLHKYGLVDKKDGFYLVAGDTLRKDELQKNCYACRHLRVCDIRDTTNEFCRYESKDDPQTCSVNGRPYSECSSCEYFKCVADEPQTSGVVWTEDAIKDEPKSYSIWASTDEPQTEPLWTCSVNGRPYSECADCEHFKCTADEPQTELVNDSPILVKDLVDDEFNPYDEECMRCKHLKLRCEFVPSYCKYEPRNN